MSEKKPSSTGSGMPKPGTVDTKLEVVVIPVSDVDQAKAFYESLGWRLDVDRVDGEFRVVQFTPTGSSCSVQFGANLTPTGPTGMPTTWCASSRAPNCHSRRCSLEGGRGSA